MTTRTVTTQAELDQALADKADQVDICSDAGVWLQITETGSSRVDARGSSRVVARGSSRVVAWDSSRVDAGGSSRVVAWGSSRVVAWGSSRVDARGSSRVDARDSSRVDARGSSRVDARDSSRVDARDSSRVDARGSSRVDARDSSRVVAGKYVAVHLHSTRVTLTGGVVIDLTQLDMTDATTWLGYHGVEVTDDGTVTLYKAVDADLRAGQGYTPTSYPIGGTVTAVDWQATARCGHGLHLGLSPSHARTYFNGEGDPRFLEVTAAVAGLIPLDDKTKVASCTVVREVDVYGDPIEAPAAVTE